MKNKNSSISIVLLLIGTSLNLVGCDPAAAPEGNGGGTSQTAPEQGDIAQLTLGNKSVSISAAASKSTGCVLWPTQILQNGTATEGTLSLNIWDGALVSKYVKITVPLPYNPNFLGDAISKNTTYEDKFELSNTSSTSKATIEAGDGGGVYFTKTSSAAPIQLSSYPAYQSLNDTSFCNIFVKLTAAGRVSGNFICASMFKLGNSVQSLDAQGTFDCKLRNQL